MNKIILQDLLDKLEHVSFKGNPLSKIIGITNLEDPIESEGLIRWSNLKNLERIERINHGTFILDVQSKSFLKTKSSCNYIFVESPRYAFQKVLGILHPNKSDWNIAKSAVIGSTSDINNNVSIGHNVVIGNGCQIFDKVVIGHNTIIHDNTIIESNVQIGANCTIGGVGFGYEKNPHGEYELIPHIGNVLIKKNAHIGNNTCIDRAVMGSTVIGENVKVDNLVHIAHGVEIKDNALIIANAMLGGSVTVGKNVWVAPSSAIINKATLGDDSLIGLGAVVVKNVEPQSVVVGNPAKPLKKKL